MSALQSVIPQNTNTPVHQSCVAFVFVPLHAFLVHAYARPAPRVGQRFAKVEQKNTPVTTKSTSAPRPARGAKSAGERQACESRGGEPNAACYTTHPPTKHKKGGKHKLPRPFLLPKRPTNESSLSVIPSSTAVPRSGLVKRLKRKTIERIRVA